MATTVKFSEDIVPLGDMKVNPGKIVRRVDETGRPVLLTSCLLYTSDAADE